jgi:hypothetical protein
VTTHPITRPASRIERQQHVFRWTCDRCDAHIFAHGITTECNRCIDHAVRAFGLGALQGTVGGE